MYSRGSGVELNKRKAAELFKKASEQNNPKAQFNLGVMYDKGTDFEKNPKKAVKYYQMAADQGIPSALFNLGILYYKGAKGVVENKTKASELFKKAVDLNPKNSKALFNLAVMYNEGDGVEKNEEMALNLFEKAAELNNKNALYNLAILYDKGSNIVDQNKEKALEYYKRAAENGNDEAQLNLGFKYQNGNGCKVDKKKASHYYEQAEEQGNFRAEFNLALLKNKYIKNKPEILRTEMNFDSDDSRKAAQLFLKYAERGCPEAFYNLGLMFSQGNGCQKDKFKTVEFYREAAKLGNIKAQYNLAKMYSEGKFIPKDESKAVLLYELAASKGHSKSQFNLGLMYFNGENVLQSYSKAFYFFEKAAAQNHPKALLNLGFMYDLGLGVIINKKKAFDLYTMSAEFGNCIANFNLALMHQKGDSGIIEKDAYKASKYYSIASDKGLVEAKFNLGLLYTFDNDYHYDLDEIIQTYKSAIEYGCNEALVNLGTIYYENLSDNQTSTNLFKRAANENIPEAQFNIGVMYDIGADGVKKNPQKAAKYYSLASVQNIWQASFNLAILYSKGEGVQKDEKIANDLFQKAGKIGTKKSTQLLIISKYFDKMMEHDYDFDECISNPFFDDDRFLNIAIMYDKGIDGYIIDKKKAFEYYKKSAKNGNAKAQLRLGAMYQKGEGCNVNIEKARKYYIMAAAQGIDIAKFNFGLSLL